MKVNSIRFSSLKTFPAAFWLINAVQFLEMLAYWALLLQLPIYIAQKDVAGGLQWEQTTKGFIFFWWAIVQNLVPIFAGGFADRYGRKNFLLVSIVLASCGFLVMGHTQSFSYFLIGTLILAFGLGLFKPALLGALANTMNEKNSSLGWGIYFMFLNTATLLAAPISKLLKEQSFYYIFLFSTLVFIFSLIIVFFINKKQVQSHSENLLPFQILKKIYKNLLKPGIILLLVAVSGFFIIYIQFYETLPNYIFDWVDSSGIVSLLNLPTAFTMATDRGTMLSYEWYYIFNSIIIITLVVIISTLTSRFTKIFSIILGLAAALIGIIFFGLFNIGYLTLIGVAFYTVGEIIINPKFSELLSKLAKPEEKSIYMSFINISMAIAFAFGSLFGSYIFQNTAEKSNVALSYIQSHHQEYKDVKQGDAMQKLSEIKGINSKELTEFLWREEKPYIFWLLFIVIGIFSICLLYYLQKKAFFS